MDQIKTYQLKAHAAPSSYIVLGGPWFLLSLCIFLTAVLHPHSGGMKMALLSGAVGLAFCIWLRGFKILISDACCEYRDGFYKSYRIAFAEIKEVKHTWVSWKNFGRTIKVPRLLIIPTQRLEKIMINVKPFKSADLAQLNEILKEFKKPSRRRKSQRN